MKAIENFELESVFKGALPLTELKSPFHGVLGDCRRDPITGKLECHFCGKFYDRILQHALGIHKVSSEQYRKKFGIALHVALVSAKESEKSRETFLSAIALHKNNVKNGTCSIDKIKLKKKSMNKKKRNHFYAYHCAFFENQNASCDEQLRKRYEVVSEMVEGDPSNSQIAEYDKGLLSAIKRKFGTTNKFRKKMGYLIRKYNKLVPEIRIISALRNFVRVNHYLPKTKAFLNGTPNTKTILRRYGSWKKALSVAGLLK